MTRRPEDIASDLSLLGKDLEGLPESARDVMREGACQLVAFKLLRDQIHLLATASRFSDDVAAQSLRALDDQQKRLGEG